MEKARILVVDDEAVVRNVLSDLFSCLDYQVETASSGLEAVRLFAPGVFDCIISDCAMRGMSGLQLLESVRYQDRKVVFFIITGIPDDTWRWDSIRNGADDFITKPFDVREFAGKVEMAIQARKA